MFSRYIVLSGHLRTISITLLSLKKNINNLGLIPVCHFWEEDDKELIQFVINELNPLIYQIEKYDEEKIKCKYRITDLYEWTVYSKNFSMLYGIESGLKLIEKIVSKNDMIIRFRYDVACDLRNINLKQIHINKNYIYSPIHNWAAILGLYFDGIIITNYNMLCFILNYFPLFLKEDTKTYSLFNSSFIEMSLKKFFLKNNIKLINLKVSSIIVRDESTSLKYYKKLTLRKFIMNIYIITRTIKSYRNLIFYIFFSIVYFLINTTRREFRVSEKKSHVYICF